MEMHKNFLPPLEGRGSSNISFQGISIDAMIHEFMVKENVPGLSMAIVQAPYIPRIVGYGLSDIHQKKLASTKTVWRIGPISQGFAAIAVLQLCDQNKVRLSDKISTYLKELPAAWHDISILQLLQHSSGIPDYRIQKGFDITEGYQSKDLINNLRDLPLLFAPGLDVHLSATNFLLLAEIVESLSQMPYQEFVKKNQIQALGLRQTFFADELASLKQENLTHESPKHYEFLYNPDLIDPIESAQGYDQNLTQSKINTRSATFKGFADIWSSAENISIWDIALAGSVLVKNAEYKDLLFKPAVLANGKVIPAMAGWQFPHHHGLMEIKGSTEGFSALLSRFTDPAELVCVTILVNKEGLDLTNLARRIASAYGKELSSGLNESELYVYESIFSVNETMTRIETQLKVLNIPIFAKFDHAKNAEEVQLLLRPTQVIVFGSPAVGTKLMQENPSIAIDLPLKIGVWEDAKGCVWVAFPRMDKLTSKYTGLNNEIIDNMEKLLEQITRKVSNFY